MIKLEIKTSNLENWKLVEGGEYIKLMDDGYYRYVINGVVERLNADTDAWERFNHYYRVDGDIMQVGGFLVQKDQSSDNWSVLLGDVFGLKIWFGTYKEADECMEKLKAFKIDHS